MLKKLAAGFIVLVLVFGLLPMSTTANAAPLTDAQREYGYQCLSVSERKVYDLVKSCLSQAEDSAVIPASLALSEDKTFEVVEMVVADHPEYFWFSGDYYYNTSGGKITSISPIYEIYDGKVSKTTIEKAKTLLNNAVSDILDDMYAQAGSDDYSRAVWLHDRVAQIVTYEETSNDQTVWGALIDGKCVCAGYARAYQYLLQMAGIKAWTVLGVSYNPATGTAENHAWNLLWIDGHCIYTDVTWNDQTHGLFHLYFGRNYEDISLDHFADPTYFAEKLPVCNCDDLGYFENYRPQNAMSGAISAKTIADLLIPQGDGKTWAVDLYVDGDFDLRGWLNNSDNLREIIGYGIGEGNFSAQIITLESNGTDSETHLTFINNNGPTGVTVKGTITSYLDDTEPVTVQLIQNGIVAYETTADPSYTFTNVVAGTYTMRVSKKNHSPVETTITVFNKGISRSLIIRPIGDVTGDGKVNLKDWSSLYGYINESTTLNDYQLSCADVNGDGKVNMKDWSRLYNHISEVESIWR